MCSITVERIESPSMRSVFVAGITSMPKIFSISPPRLVDGTLKRPKPMNWFLFFSKPLQKSDKGRYGFFARLRYTVQLS